MKLSGRLGVGFGVLLALVAVVGGWALWEMHVLSELNRKLYEHPFTVKSAVLSVDADVIRMHRTMKDVALARNEADIKSALALVNQLEQKVLGQFKIIEERFLGEPAMYRRAEKMFTGWKPIREEVAALMRGGEYAQAAEITQGRGAAHVLRIVSAMNDLKNFAESKAGAFYVESRQARDQAFAVMYAIIGITVVTGVILAVAIARSITKPAGEIAEVSQAIARGDLTRRITYQGRNEIGQMAQSLREMLSGVIGEGQSIKNGLQGPVWTTDRELVITYLNPEAACLARDLSGLPPERIVGSKRVEEIFTDQHGALAGLASTTLTEKDMAEADVQFLIREQEVIHHAYTSPLRDLNGKVMGVMGVSTDITWRKQAEQEKAHLEEQLRQSQKMESIGTLAGGVAHDFNNILSAILGYTELTLEEMPEDHPLRRNLEKIFDSGWRARKLVAQLLAFSRKQMLELNSFSLNEVVSQTRDMLAPIIGEDVELQTLLNPEAGLVRADFHQMEQVLMNLVGNAREAMPAGGKITIETDNVVLDQEYADSHLDASPGPHAMLAVSDNGSGMDQATRQRIFEPFFTTKEMGKGTGLGLAMVYGIVKQLGGNIYVYSEPDQGSTFKVYLPRHESREHMRPQPAQAEVLSTGDETILMVEDDRLVREFICAALGKLGYRVLEASDCDDALRIMASQGAEVDLLLTDVIMPGMSGRELAERLQAERPGLKVLYISGYTANVIVHHGVLDQGVPFLQKPVSMANLANKVREVLETQPA